MEIVGYVTAVLGIILTILNIGDRIYTNKKRKREQIDEHQRRQREEGAREASTNANLDTIRQGNATILTQLDKMDLKMDQYGERITRCEESVKSAHHRIDGLERRKIDA